MRYLSYILISLALFSWGCSEEFEPKPLTYSKLLTGENSKSWLMVGLQFREDGKPLQSYELPPDDCAFDDLYVFYNNPERTFIIDEGNSKCNAEDPQEFYRDTWAVVNATASLEFVIPLLIPVKLPYVIQELTESKLVVEIYFNEDKQSYRMIFKAVQSN